MKLCNDGTSSRSMQNGRDDNLDNLHDSINVAARELDASRAEALDAIDRARFS